MRMKIMVAGGRFYAFILLLLLMMGTAAVSFAADRGAVPSATSSFDVSGYAPSFAFHLSIAAVIPAGTSSVYAIEDKVPAGWGVSEISNDGAFDSVSGKVKWLFMDSQARTVKYTITPSANAVGQYSFSGTAMFDMAAVAVTGARTISPLNATPTSLQLTASVCSPTATGVAIKLTAAGNSVATLEYRFRVKYTDGTGTSVWTTVQEYGTKNTATWTPTEAHSYTIIAYARVKGTTVAYLLYRELLMTVKPATTDLRVALNPPAPTVTGTPVRISVTPENGGTMQYRFKVKYQLPGGTYSWQTLQEYSVLSSYTWTPTEARPYLLYVYSRETGSANTYDLFKELPYQVNEPVSVLNLVASCPSPTGVGTPVKLTATATNGGTLEYKFYALYNDALNVQQTELIRDYAAGNVVTWSPKQATTYTSVVALVREKGKAVDFDQKAEITSYKVVATVSNLTLKATSAAAPAVGVPITLTTTATGGGTLEYQFKVKYTGATGSVWYTLQDYSPNSNCTWTPSAAQGAHAYTIIAYAREQGTTAYKVYRELLCVVK